MWVLVYCVWAVRAVNDFAAQLRVATRVIIFYIKIVVFDKDSNHALLASGLEMVRHGTAQYFPTESSRRNLGYFHTINPFSDHSL